MLQMSQGGDQNLLRLDPRVRSRRACSAHSKAVHKVITVSACNTALCRTLHWHHAVQQGLEHWCDIYTLTHLQLNEASGVFLVIQPLVILKGGNLLIIEAVG